MKILFVIDTLGPGGKERRFTELIKILTLTREIEISLVVMSNDIHYSEIFQLGIEIKKIIRKTPRDLTVFRQFMKLMKSVRPDAVHCWESMTAVYLAPVCKLLGCPLINGMVTNVPLKQNIFNYHWRRARLTFPLSRVIISNSYAGLKAYRVPKRKGIVIYNGFDFSRLNELRDAAIVRNELLISTDYVVGMVASFCENKDYRTFFTAAQQLLSGRRDITFVVIGSDTDSENSVRMVEEKLRQYFRFLGRRSSVESYINAMDIGVLATYTEGISNSVMEYMALGKPVVATVGGGTEELVKSGETGFLVNPSDPEIMAYRIEELIKSEELRTRMGSLGKDRIRTQFSHDIMLGNYMRLYRQICKN